MAIKGFGYTGVVDQALYNGSSVGQGVALAAVMPEKGKILAVRVKLARYPGSAPRVYGVVWNRSTGAVITQSPAYTEPNSDYVSGNLSTLKLYQLAVNEAVVEAGTLLWIGFSKDASAASRACYYGVDENAPGYTWHRDDGPSAVPAPFVVSNTYTNQALWVEVYYETGGQVKVFSGSAFVSKSVKVWNGSAWVPAAVMVWNGSAWVESNS